MTRTLKIFSVLLFLFAGIRDVSAQMRVDVMGGWAVPSGLDYDKAVKFGLGYSLDVTYAPGLLDGMLSFGLAKDGNVMFCAGVNIGEKKTSVKASLLGLTGVKARFDYKNSTSAAKPFGALTIGVGRLKYGYSEADYDGIDQSGVQGDIELNYETAYGFGVKPEIGVAFGWFQMGIGWIIPVKYGVHKMKAGSILYSIGFHL